MAQIQVLIKIATLFGSFVFGFIVYYFANPKTKKLKEQVDFIGNYLITYVVFILVGKVLYHYKLFFQDPMAVLAYPSDSPAFYIGTILFIVAIIVQLYLEKLQLPSLIHIFVPVVVGGSFLYEFIQMQFYDKGALSYLIVHILLLVGYILLDRSVRNDLLILFGWMVGLVVLSFVEPFIMIFQFIVSIWFVLFMMIVIVVTYIYLSRRKGI